MKPLFVLWALLLAALAGPARAADGIPPKPSPFTFVTDQAGLMQPAEAQKLASGLSRYASSTGTPIIVVTVPTLGGMSVADMARQIGDSWQIGQSGKNNGVVVLVTKQEHKVSIQAGSGLTDRITPDVTQRVIGEMTPDFKQNNYFAGLRKGLNTLLLAANPSSDPRKNSATTATSAPDAASAQSNMADNSAAATTADPAGSQQAEAVEPPSTGLPWGTILLGGVVVIGGIFLLKRLFSGNSNNNNGGGQAPNFTGNRPGGNAPNFGAPNAPQGNYPQQGGYGAPQQSSGPGIGGILATGAAAAAGAYIGNRMSDSHESSGANAGRQFDNNGNAGNAAAAGGTGAADSYFSHDNSSNNDNSNSGPDYFSDNNSGSSGGDYFSSDDSSSGGDTSGDFGGGDFSSSDDNSGSW